MGKKGQPLAERLMEKVRVTDAGCWEWIGTRDQRGYGMIFRGNCGSATASMGRGSWLRAHRVSYELHVGAIPNGLQLDHLCRNKWCVNPLHLEPVTSRQNTLRGEAPAAQNARKTSCDRGHPLFGDNLFIENGGRRRCRACHNANKRAARARAAAGAK